MILALNGSKEMKVFLAALKKKKIAADSILSNVEKILFRNKVPGIWIMDERTFASWARDIYLNEEQGIPEDITNDIKTQLSKKIDTDDIINGFKYLFSYINGKKGFHRWDNLKYFLFEYEEALKNEFRETAEKVSFGDFEDTTIEHIMPQSYQKHWNDQMEQYIFDIEDEKKAQAQKILLNTIGNLTILKNGKNASLGNRSWSDKKERFSTGSYNEIEVAKRDVWDQKAIWERGAKLLKFLEIK